MPGKRYIFLLSPTSESDHENQTNQSTDCHALVLPWVISLLSTWYLQWGNSQPGHHLCPGTEVEIPVGHVATVGWGGGHMGGGTNPTLGQDPTLSFCPGPCKSCSWPVQRPRHMGEILSEGKDELHSSITEKEAQAFLGFYRFWRQYILHNGMLLSFISWATLPLCLANRGWLKQPNWKVYGTRGICDAARRHGE